MKVSGINVDENISIINKMIENNSSLSLTEKKSLEEHNEVIQVLLERFARKRVGKRSSERSSPSSQKDKLKKESRKERNQLPSKRYPDVPVIEKEVSSESPPTCPCCNEEMVDSGLRESSEELTVIPKKYVIYRFLKTKYKCSSCHGGMKTAETRPRILPGSSYSDDFILDVALSKYCDLIPMERYASMAERQGLEGLPPQSLIGLTHHGANFVERVYEKLKWEVLRDLVIHADETPHRMLEGGEGKKNWYLWGFSTEFSCFFDIRNTRSGDVASEFLKDSSASYLVSDVFSGYSVNRQGTTSLFPYLEKLLSLEELLIGRSYTRQG